MNEQIMIISNKQWYELIDRIKKIEESINSSDKNAKCDELLTSKEVVRILGISDKTWQNYRNKGIIPFSQIGRKIYVRKEDLDRFMNENRISERREI